MPVHPHCKVQAESVVVDGTQQRVTRVLRVVVVEARVQGDAVAQRMGVVQVVVVLVPDVLQLRGIQVAGNSRDAAERYASPSQVLGGLVIQIAVGGGQAAHAALVVGLVVSDLTAFQHPARKAVVGQADALERLRQHAGFPACDHRVGDEQVTGFQFGIKRTNFQRCTARRKVGGRITVAATNRQDTAAAGTATAIELETEHGVRIQTKTDHARGITRSELGDKTLAPLLAVMGVRAVDVVVHVVVTQMQVEGRAVDKPLF